MPEPVLVGRNAEKLAAHAESLGGFKWSTDVAQCLADPGNEIYFDASVTAGRVARARRALDAGKHIFLEKPAAGSLEEAMALARDAKAEGLQTGVVQDKLGLPGLAKMVKLKEQGYFGRLLSARLDFGWWVFDGEIHTAQRPSWNYKKAEGGGLVLDMFPHWRYITESLVGPIRAVSARISTRLDKRIDEAGKPYDVDVEDEVFATFEHDGGVLTNVTSSWATRIRRDDMMTLQIDGKDGSAICGLHRCFIQPASATPRPHFDVDRPQSMDFDSTWLEVPEVWPVKNGYRQGWEHFLRAIVEGAENPTPLLAGARHVQLAEACYQSSRERRWVDLEELVV
jgi:predicted dehydrogenase